jgi:hypothetical protein
MKIIITNDQVEELHDLITIISSRQDKQERDVKNLMNLIHVINGEGVRRTEYLIPYSERRLDMRG